MEEGHARLQQFEEHGVVKVTARIHGNLHVKKAAEQRGSDASDDAECVHVYGIHSAQQAVRVQREDRPKEAIVVHVRELFNVTSVFDTPDIFQGGPV